MFQLVGWDLVCYYNQCRMVDSRSIPVSVRRVGRKYGLGGILSVTLWACLGVFFVFGAYLHKKEENRQDGSGNEKRGDPGTDRSGQ